MNEEELPSTKKEAKDKGLRYYFTGKSCINGHICKRKVSNRGCYLCELEHNKRWITEYIKKEKGIANRRNHYEQNKQSYKDSSAKRRIAGKDKEWRKNNKGRVNELIAKREADKIKRTPSWANKELIKAFYKFCPEGYTVDHIIPLRGRTVSGLHVEYNLQYLTKSENSKKNNTFDPDRFKEQR